MVTLSPFSLCNCNFPNPGSRTPNRRIWSSSSFSLSGYVRVRNLSLPNSRNLRITRNSSLSRRLTVFAATEGSAKNSSKSEESIPSWAKPDADEPPPWARGEAQKSSSKLEVPFYVYLLSSAIIAIAAIGSAFEYVNQRPVFGVLNSDSVFYAPVLGFFAFTGIPTSAYLWFKSVQTANKEAEEQDRRDGFL